jgi:hypothetical protein
MKFYREPFSQRVSLVAQLLLYQQQHMATKSDIFREKIYR